MNSSVTALRIGGDGAIQEADLCYEQSMQGENRQSQIDAAYYSTISGRHTPSAPHVRQLSVFDAINNPSEQLETEEADEMMMQSENDGVAAGVTMTMSKRICNMIKLNNPYDEVTIVR